MEKSLYFWGESVGIEKNIGENIGLNLLNLFSISGKTKKLVGDCFP